MGSWLIMPERLPAKPEWRQLEQFTGFTLVLFYPGGRVVGWISDSRRNCSAERLLEWLRIAMHIICVLMDVTAGVWLNCMPSQGCDESEALHCCMLVIRVDWSHDLHRGYVAAAVCSVMGNQHLDPDQDRSLEPHITPSILCCHISDINISNWITRVQTWFWVLGNITGPVDLHWLGPR